MPKRTVAPPSSQPATRRAQCSIFDHLTAARTRAAPTTNPTPKPRRVRTWEKSVPISTGRPRMPVVTAATVIRPMRSRQASDSGFTFSVTRVEMRATTRDAAAPMSGK
jgi:hypothetical protein